MSLACARAVCTLWPAAPRSRPARRRRCRERAYAWARAASCASSTRTRPTQRDGAAGARLRLVVAVLRAGDRALDERYRVLAVDLPGFGKSDTPRGRLLARGARRRAGRDPRLKKGVPARTWSATRGARRWCWRSRAAIPSALGRLVHHLRAGSTTSSSCRSCAGRACPASARRSTRIFYRQDIGERLYLNFHDPILVTQQVVDEVEKQMATPGAVAAALAAARGMRFAEASASTRRSSTRR